jgi:RNA polymerase sigma-70 factor (ECF subfamily)
MRGHSEDIVQLAMIRVAKALDARSEGDGPLPTSYLWRVAYTTTIDELRKMRGHERTRERATEAGVAQPGAALAPDAAVEAGELGDAIRVCVGALSPNRRRAVTLYLQGHSVPESGELLGWTRKKTENLVFRGLADLRRCLKSKGFRR